LLKEACCDIIIEIKTHNIEEVKEGGKVKGNLIKNFILSIAFFCLLLGGGLIGNLTLETSGVSSLLPNEDFTVETSSTVTDFDLEWYNNNVEAEEFEINTVAEFLGFVRLTQNKAGLSTAIDFEDKTIKLGADLDFENVSIYDDSDSENIIDNTIAVFDGTFNGQGHKIKNISFKYTGNGEISSLGLFPQGIRDLQNLIVDTSSINIAYSGSTEFYFGLLGKSFGNAKNIAVTNTTATVLTESGTVCFGGMFSTIEGVATLENCFVKKLTFTSSGAGNTNFLGGIASHAYGSSRGGVQIVNSYTEDISFTLNNATYGLGGLVGFSEQASYTNCETTNISLISMSEEKQFCLVGGFAAKVDSSDLVDCKAINITIKNKPTQEVDVYDIGGFLGAINKSCSFTNCVVDEVKIEADASNVAGFYGNAEADSTDEISFENCSALTLDFQAVGNYITGNWSGFAGGNEEGIYHYKNCSTQGKIFSNINPVSGFQFSNQATDYENCFVDMLIYVKNATAGLFGISEDSGGTYVNCNATGTISVATKEQLFVSNIEKVLENSYYFIHNGGIYLESETSNLLFPKFEKDKYAFYGFYGAVDLSGEKIVYPEKNKLYFIKWGNSLTYNPNCSNYKTTNIEFSDGNESTIVLDCNDQSLNYANEGYTFLEWNTKADGSGQSYTANSTFFFDGLPATLYAQWTKTIDIYTLRAIPNQIYTGKELTPELMLTITESGEDVTSLLKDVQYTSNRNAGTATVTFKIGEDSTEYTTNFEILKANYDLSKVTLLNEKVVYNGMEQFPHLINLPNGAQIQQVGRYVNAGTYIVNINIFLEGNENYNEASMVFTDVFEIEKATYNMSEVFLTSKAFVYDGQYHKLEVSGLLPNGVSVSYIGNEQKDVGEYVCTAIFVGDLQNYYEMEDLTATLTILAKELESKNSEGKTIVNITNEKGFNPYVELEVDTFNDQQRLESYSEFLTEKQSAKYVYEINLTKDGYQVYPNGVVTVKLLIPEGIKSKNIRIATIVNGKLKFLDSVVDGKYVTATTRNISELVLIYQQKLPVWAIVLLSLLIVVGIGALALGIVALVLKKQPKAQTKKK